MTILRFSALWCPSCLVMKSRWKEVLKTHPDLTVIDYEYDTDSSQVALYRIGTLLPVAIFLDHEIEIGRIQGERSIKELKTILEGFPR